MRQQFLYIKQGGWIVFSRDVEEMTGDCFDTEETLFHYFYIMGNNLPDGHYKK